MKIEEGKFYRTRDGKKVLAEKAAPFEPFAFRANFNHYHADGKHYYGQGERDLVSEWLDGHPGPVRTVTRKEMVEGKYGIVTVDVHRDQLVVVVEPAHQPSPAELRAAAEVFTQLADALEDQK